MHNCAEATMLGGKSTAIGPLSVVAVCMTTVGVVGVVSLTLGLQLQQKTSWQLPLVTYFLRLSSRKC